MIETFKRNWWVWAIHGLILVAFGLVSLNINDRANTGGVILSITGIAMISLGTAIILISLRFKDRISALPFWIALGILDTILGIAIVYNVNAAGEMLENILGAWMILSGIALMYVYIRQKDNNTILLINGIVIIAFGSILVFDPFSSPEIMNILMSIGSITMGLFVIAFAFKSRPSSKEKELYKLRDKDRKEKNQTEKQIDA